MVDGTDRTHRPRGRPRGFDKDKALEAAMLLFWERGYEGVSMADLRQAMQLSTPSLYGAFESKANLYRMALRRYMECEGPEWVIPTSGSVAAGMATVLDLVVQVIARPGRPRGCMVATGFLESTPETRDLAETTKTIRDRNLVQLTALMRNGVKSGELRADTDPEILARHFKSVMEGLAIQALDGAEVGQLRATADLALANLTAHLGPKASRSRRRTTAAAASPDA